MERTVVPGADGRREVHRRWRRAAVALATGLALAGCADEPPPEAEVARPVRIVTVTSGEPPDVLAYPGTIQPAQNAEMAFEVGGRIIAFPVDEGQQVAASALLARLDPRDFEAALAEQLAQQNAARANYERAKALYETDALSRQELDAKRRDYEVVAARVATAQKALEDTALRAPFAGRVAKKLVADFANVQAKQAVVVLQDDTTLEVVVYVPERDWARARPGLSLDERSARARPTVTVTSLPERAYPARLKEAATTADPTTRTFAVTLSFANPADVRILSGMTARVTIHAGALQRDAVGHRLPATAVVGGADGAPSVWVVDPAMVVRRRPVEVGEMSGTEIEITGGLADGDRVAVSGVHHLREGMPVRPLGE